MYVQYYIMAHVHNKNKRGSDKIRQFSYLVSEKTYGNLVAI